MLSIIALLQSLGLLEILCDLKAITTLNQLTAQTEPIRIKYTVLEISVHAQLE